MGSSEPGAGRTKGQEGFMMAHVGEERLSHRAWGTAWREKLQRWGRGGTARGPWLRIVHRQKCWPPLTTKITLK